MICLYLVFSLGVVVRKISFLKWPTTHCLSTSILGTLCLLKYVRERWSHLWLWEVAGPSVNPVRISPLLCSSQGTRVLRGWLLVAVCCCCSLNCVQVFATPWTVAHQASLSMGFFRQEHWSGLLFPSLVDLPDPGIEPTSPANVWQADSLPLSLQWMVINGRWTPFYCEP